MAPVYRCFICSLNAEQDSLEKSKHIESPLQGPACKSLQVLPSHRVGASHTRPEKNMVFVKFHYIVCVTFGWSAAPSTDHFSPPIPREVKAKNKFSLWICLETPRPIRDCFLSSNHAHPAARFMPSETESPDPLAPLHPQVSPAEKEERGTVQYFCPFTPPAPDRSHKSTCSSSLSSSHMQPSSARRHASHFEVQNTCFKQLGLINTPSM